jgi:cupin 2 domain-containing protein
MVKMTPGDFFNIPAHKKHRVEWTKADESMICLAVHYGNGK